MAFRLDKYLKLAKFIDKTSKNKEIPTSIIAVTKTQPVSVIKEAINAGVLFFGESKVQEAFKKYLELKSSHKDLRLHMIGPLQSNKVKKALQIFDYFHTLDRESLVIELSKYRELANIKSFFIQVNTGYEKQKSGIIPTEADEFINYCLYEVKLNVIGLMCLPPIKEDPLDHFLILKNIALKNNLRHLSMGMSKDYKTAINYGATFIRIGAHFFGERLATYNEN